MTNQIKHNSPTSVLSQFNPISILKPNTRKQVNEFFILPILQSFFSTKGGLDNFSELDSDKLQTEVEFERAENFVKTYLYKEIIEDVKKVKDEVVFKPKYVISFDSDLTEYKVENGIRYGVIRLGEIPILYYIYIDLQELIRFIKKLPEEINELQGVEKIIETGEEKRNRLLDNIILNKSRLLESIQNEQSRDKIIKEIELLKNRKTENFEGQSGKLRINLSWDSTDDLDLHIITPNGEIAYKNKLVENKGVIGKLDVDKNAGTDISSNPQENINFDALPFGLHKVYVHFYTKRERNDVPFRLTIIPEHGEGRIYEKIAKGAGSNTSVVNFEQINGQLNFVEFFDLPLLSPSILLNLG